MMAEVLGIGRPALVRWERRRRQPPRIPRGRVGRPPAISAEDAAALRKRYLDSHRQWGPCVLAEWARREGIGRWSPSTIARVIADLRPPTPEPKPPVRYAINAANVMWSEDGAGFRQRGKKRELVVVQDECSRFKTAHALADGPARGADVRAVLEQAIATHGAPLVLKRDGGSIFADASVMALLEAHDIVVVTSPPHYPRYNGKKERSFRDVRAWERAARHGWADIGLERRLDEAIDDLNYRRPRPVLGGLTAAEAYESKQHLLPDRKRFKQEVLGRQRELEALAASRDELAAARRRAVEEVLSWYGFITWNADVSTDSRARTWT